MINPPKYFLLFYHRDTERSYQCKYFTTKVGLRMAIADAHGRGQKVRWCRCYTSALHEAHEVPYDEDDRQHTDESPLAGEVPAVAQVDEGAAGPGRN